MYATIRLPDGTSMIISFDVEVRSQHSVIFPFWGQSEEEGVWSSLSNGIDA